VKNYQQTPKQRRLQKKQLEAMKRAVAHSKPRFDPRESWSSRKKVGGVPLCTLENKQHTVSQVWFWLR
jgi:hypothetical protein